MSQSNSGAGGGRGGQRPMSEQIDAELQKRAQEQHHARWSDFISRYALNIEFPARVSSQKAHEDAGEQEGQAPKTDIDLINARLLENGLLFEDFQSIPEMQTGVAQVVDNLMRTGCFKGVRLQLDDADPREMTIEEGENAGQTVMINRQSINVILDEKNWYSLYVGGGFKEAGFEQALNTSNLGKLPKAQFETSATLLNLTGHLDHTALRYAVDQTALSTLSISHERPLYAWLGTNHSAGEALLAMARGSQYALGVRAYMDTVDYEWTRSYQEVQRIVSARLDNMGNTPARAEQTMYATNTTPYWGVDWSLALRDIVPRRHAKLPYAADASPEVVACSGPSVTHSVAFETRSNGIYCDDRFQPTSGYDYHLTCQLAGPPGDVGFFKAQGGGSYHAPIVSSSSSSSSDESGESPHPVALHGSLNAGYLHAISYYGLCQRPPTLSDRFYVGGPMQLRGFLPAGIGPRTSVGGSTSPNGDAVGGTFFYTASLAASVEAPAGVRVFGFANAGTAVGDPALSIRQAVLQTSRASIGAGVSAATPMGRFEATYAWPIRYGPRDARKNVQFGFGFTFG